MTKRLSAVAVGIAVLALLGAGAYFINSSGQEVARPTIIMGDPAKGEFSFSFLDKDGNAVDKLVIQNNVETAILLVNNGEDVHELRSDLFRLFQFDIEIPGIGEIETVGIRDLDLETGKEFVLKVTPKLSGKVMDEKAGEVEFELGCFLEGHYMQGMKGTIVVVK